jgi:hypothetical protein
VGRRCEASIVNSFEIVRAALLPCSASEISVYDCSQCGNNKGQDGSAAPVSATPGDTPWPRDLQAADRSTCSSWSRSEEETIRGPILDRGARTLDGTHAGFCSSTGHGDSDVPPAWPPLSRGALGCSSPRFFQEFLSKGASRSSNE